MASNDKVRIDPNDPRVLPKINNNVFKHISEGEGNLMSILGGASPEYMLHRVKDLAKRGGDRVRLFMDVAPSGDGITEAQQLTGNEEALSYNETEIRISELSHAIKRPGRNTISYQRDSLQDNDQAYRGLIYWITERFNQIIGFAACGYNAKSFIDSFGQRKPLTAVYTGFNTLTPPTPKRWLKAQISNSNGSEYPYISFMETEKQVADVGARITLGHLDYALAKIEEENNTFRPGKHRESGSRREYICLVHPKQAADLQAALAPNQWTALNAQLYSGTGDKNPFTEGYLGTYKNIKIVSCKYVTDGIDEKGEPLPDVKRAVIIGAQGLAFALGGTVGSNINSSVILTPGAQDYNRKDNLALTVLFGIKKIRYGNLEDLATFVISTSVKHQNTPANRMVRFSGDTSEYQSSVPTVMSEELQDDVMLQAIQSIPEAPVEPEVPAAPKTPAAKPSSKK